MANKANDTGGAAPADKATDAAKAAEATPNGADAGEGNADNTAGNPVQSGNETAENTLILTDETKKFISDAVTVEVAKLAQSETLAKAVSDAIADGGFDAAIAQAVADAAPAQASAPAAPANAAEQAAVDRETARKAAEAHERKRAADAKVRAADAKAADKRASEAAGKAQVLHDALTGKDAVPLDADDFELVSQFDLRVSNGETLHSDFVVPLSKHDVRLVAGRVQLARDVELPESGAVFEAREFFLIADGRAARAELVGSLVFGGGRRAALRDGDLQFSLAPAPAQAGASA